MYYISIIIKVFAFRYFILNKGAQLGQFYLNYICTLYMYEYIKLYVL